MYEYTFDKTINEFTKIPTPKSLKKKKTRVVWEFWQDLTENLNEWLKLKKNWKMDIYTKLTLFLKIKSMIVKVMKY
jgi:hypothetical protein